MRKPVLFTALLVFVLAGLGCNLVTRLAQPESAPTLPPPQASEVGQPAGPPPTAYPEAPPTVTAPPPTPTTAANPYQPTGFLTTNNDGSALTVYNTQGQPTGQIQSPGLSVSGSFGGEVHVAGGAPEGVVSVPVFYYAYEETPKIKQNLNGQISDLISNADLTYLRGALGQAVVAYVTVTWSGEALVSHLYFRGLQGGGASWLLERVDPESWAAFPLAVQAINDEPQGVWYSLAPFGIGGDIVFPPQKGLYYLDLTAGGTENLYLAEDFNPVGLSPDLTWVAYVPADSGFVDGDNPKLTLYNLYTTVGIEIPINPASNRGAGYVVFSPENQRVAWMEGSGWMMAETPNFHAKVVIADINGNVLSELDAERFLNLTTSATASWVQPVGWLDAENLIVEVRNEDWSEIVLARVRYDGSEISLLAQGGFAGFVYPGE